MKCRTWCSVLCRSLKRETWWIIQAVVLGKQQQSKSSRRWVNRAAQLNGSTWCRFDCVCVCAGEVGEDWISLLDHWMLPLLFLHGENTHSQNLHLCCVVFIYVRTLIDHIHVLIWHFEPNALTTHYKLEGEQTADYTLTLKRTST